MAHSNHGPPRWGVCFVALYGYEPLAVAIYDHIFALCFGGHFLDVFEPSSTFQEPCCGS